jgi:two-component system sensor histidine kinase HydH
MNKRRLAGVSPWVIIGTVAVLAPVFLIMTWQNLDRQQTYTTRLLVDRGDALIRAFEAGARTGLGLKWGHFQLQKLLIETAQQPDIDYLIITDESGLILADSDPALIGEYYGTDLDLKAISGMQQPRWRRVPNTEGADTFEIYRQFKPDREDARIDRGPARPDTASKPPQTQTRGGELVIFIGLDMGPIDAAREADYRQTVMMATIFLLIGISGIISLLLAQGYRSARTSLSRIQAFSDNLIENMPMGLVAVDAAGRIIVFNQAAESIAQRRASDVIGRNAADILPEACRELLAELGPQKKIIEREIDCLLPDGRMIHLEGIASFLEGETGQQEQILLFRDITEIRHLKKEIARSQHLASLGSLAAGVAHEIRNPLSSIKGFATYFKQRYRDNPEDGKTADIMIQEVDRLNRVISQLLDYARPMAMHRQAIPAQSLIQHTLSLVETQAREKGILLQKDLPADLPLLSVDPDYIKQVLLNLYLNALAAMEAGGVLSVSVSALPAGRMRIEVRDTGVGIAPEDRSRIFDPYYTTKPSGAGLGLAVVQKIVDAHGGEIQVAGMPGHGTTIAILLPMEEINGG